MFNTTSQQLVIVKQFRPGKDLFVCLLVCLLVVFTAVYSRKLFDKLKQEGTMDLAKLSEVTELKQETLCHSREGITYEVCAGLVDRTSSLEEIAQSEVRMSEYDVILTPLK